MPSLSTGRVYLVQITALRLEALQLDDQGLYECRILLLDEPTDELQNGTWTQLSVTGELYGIVCACICCTNAVYCWASVSLWSKISDPYVKYQCQWRSQLSFSALLPRKRKLGERHEAERHLYNHHDWHMYVISAKLRVCLWNHTSLFNIIQYNIKCALLSSTLVLISPEERWHFKVLMPG